MVQSALAVPSLTLLDRERVIIANATAQAHGGVLNEDLQTSTPSDLSPVKLYAGAYSSSPRMNYGWDAQALARAGQNVDISTSHIKSDGYAYDWTFYPDQSSTSASSYFSQTFSVSEPTPFVFQAFLFKPETYFASPSDRYVILEALNGTLKITAPATGILWLSSTLLPGTYKLSALASAESGHGNSNYHFLFALPVPDAGLGLVGSAFAFGLVLAGQGLRNISRLQ